MGKYWWEEEEEQKKQQSAQSTSQTSQSTEQKKGYWWDDESTVSTAANQITDRVNTWLQNHNNYISNYKNRYSNRKYNYEDDYVKDASDWLDTVSKQKSNFDAEADNILSYMDQYKSYLNPEWMDSVRNILTDARKDQGSIIEGVSKDNEWWNSFGSEELVKQYGSAEEAYKYYQRDDGYRKKYEGKSHNYLQTALQTMGDGDEKEWLSSYAPSVLYDERSKADLDAMAKEIEDMENLYNDAFTVGHWYNEYALGFAPYDSKRMNTYNRLKDEYGGDIYNLEEAISKKKREMTLASRVQEGIKLSGVGDETSEYYDPEFKQYTGYTGSTWIDGGFDRFFSWDDSAGMKTGYEDIRYDYINDPDAVTKVLSKSANDADLHLLSGLQPYQHMTEDQVATYNYYYAKHGKEAAGHYLDSIQDSLNATQGQQMAQRIEDKWLLQQLSGIGAGLDQAHSGLKNVFSNADYIPTSATQYASGYVRENLGENGGAFSQGLYDLITTTANMAPSILLSTAIGTLNPTVGAAVGNAMMGASAAGNAYSDAINRGFGKKEARTYSTLIGASEVALGSLLGGISKLGGVSSKLANAVAGIDKAFLRFSLQYGGKIASESLEEGLQEILDPLLQNAIMYADEDVNWNEVAYSALLGGLSAGLLEGVGTVAQVAQTEAALNKQAVKEYGGMTDAIIQEGLESDQKSKSYKLAQKYQKQVEGQNGKAGKAMTGAQIRNLLAANQDQVTPKDMKLIQQAAEKRLTELGQTDDVSKLAEIATRYATGGKVSKEEKSFLANSKYGSRVYNELLPKNIESGDYTSEWTEDIGTREVNVAQYGKKRLQAQIRAALDFMANPEDPNAYKSLEKRVGTESKLSVSESGKATIRESGKEVDLKQAEVVNFVQDKNTGKITDMTMKVDGEEVKASGIDYTDSSESYLFDAVQKIENITPGAATVAVRGYDPASGQTVSEYLNGFDEGFNYGYHNYSEADLKSGEFAPKLSQEQMMSAYRLGQSARNISDVAADAPVVKMRTEADAKLSAEQKLAKQKAQIESDDVEVYFEDGGTVIKFDEHTGKYDKKRNAAVNTAKFLSKLGIGGKYYFFESYLSKTLKDAEGNRLRVYKDANGNEVEAPNGIYKETDGSIHIDLNAGDYGQGTALFTLGHELTHFVKAQSKKQFAILSDLVKEAFDKTDTSMHERVLAKQKFLSDKRGEVVSYTEAHEEVVADAMSTMLTDGSFHEKLMEIKVKDKGLFNTIKRFFEKMIAKFRKEYDDLTPDQQDAQDIRQLKDMFDKIQNAFVEALVESSENFHASMESVVESNAEAVSANEIVTDGAVVTDGNGERFSIRSMKHDIAEGKMFEDLKTHCNWTDAQVKELRTQLKALVEYMIPYRDILDMNESYGAEGRRFSPYKPNSDPLYKISMDFSTLCSKRLLTQYVIENLQLRENRPMSAEEQMAIRAMLNEYRKVEKGLQVACAMCYVEAARLKSPNQIQKWMDDPSTAMRNYFADKNPEFAAYVKKSQGDFKESRGYDRDASKKQMKEANKKSGSKDVNELNKLRPKLREQYQPSAEELAIIEKAKSLPNSTYLTAGNLATLSETDPAIYAAYTSFVRTATRSKSLETDEPYYYGDSTRDNGNGIIVSDSFIEAVNRENGMRFSSWSDWRIQHLLDYITAVIDNSVRGAAMHGYTKFGDEVRVLGKTGMMFNMSGVTGSQTGLNKDGSLNFSDTESIDVNEAIQLREEFPEHAGLQCIGVGNEHIIALLRSDIIDYVIPYHVSGLNAALRRMADIHGWKDYTGTQNASIDKSIKFENAVDQEHWHEEPSFSEFFVGYDTGMSGIDAMRASAERYKQLCKDRGLTPKFNQFANEDNYWKLLIDRKMINQQTGNLIRQKAVTPTFDFDVIKGVVDKFVDNYDAGLESRALNHIVENWDTIPQRIKDLKKGSKTKKSVDTLANQTVAAQPTKHSDRYWYPKMTKTEIAEVKDIAQNEAKKTDNYLGIDVKWLYNNQKGHRYFALYSTQREKVTLLYACKDDSAEYEHDLLKDIIELGDSPNESIDTGSTTISEILNRATNAAGQQVTNRSGTAGARSNAGNAAVHSRNQGKRYNKAFINCLENIEKVQSRYGVDDHYLFAVERGDLKTAQRMVDEAAKAAGYTVKGYHGSRTPGFTVVDKYSWLWFARDEAVASGYGVRDDVETNGKPHNKKGVYSMLYNLGNNLVVYADGASWGELPVTEDEYPGVYVDEENGYITTNAMAEWAERNGYDSITFEDVDDGGLTTVDVVFNPNRDAKSADPVTYDDDGNVIPLSQRFDKTKDDIRYSERASNKELASMDDTALYIKNTDKANYIGMIFNGAKTEETRSRRTLDAFIGKDFYVTDGKYVYGSIVLGEPHKYTEAEFHQKKNQLKHRVPVGDEYDIKPGGTKWAYPIESYKKFDKPKKLSDSTEYKNSFQARQVRYSERGEGTSNRHLLANAFDGITNGSEEYKLIQRYKGYIAELNSLENKLSEFNQQIREIRFTKGKYDAEKLEKLEAETEKIAEAINKYDRYLISLEASEPLRKVIERERKKEAQKTKEHVKEIQQNKKLRAEQTELRHKIRKTIRDLDKILNRGNKKLNVKEDMQNVVSTALKAADILFTDNYDNFDMLRNGLGVDLSDSEEALVNECTRMLKDIDKMPTDGYDSWQARQEAENKLKAKMSKLKEVFARERKRLNNTKVSSILGELADAYSKLQDSEYSYVQGAYIEPVYTFLKNLQTEVGGTIVSDMTKDQLESLYAAYKMVLTTVRKANQMFNAELKMTREQLGNAVIEEVLKAGGVHLLGTKTGDAISQASWNNTKPVWVANRIGSDTFGKLMNGLFKGQYNFAVDVDEAKQFKLSMDEKYHPRNWDAEKLYKFESSTGKEFSLNLQQIMSLYAFSKREQAYSHLLNGGFVFEDNSTVVVDGKLGIKKTYIHKGAASYKLNEATLNGIINSLTAEQKAYVDEMQKYLSEVMGAKGNEVSMQLYGIQMFKEQFYFPLRSSGAYMEKAKEAEMKKQQGQINLVNSGFTHAVKPEARNPIILSGFMDVWAEHCNEMSMYHSMVLPMEDFRKVYNYSTVHDENMESASVFQTIQDAYGKAATNYIDQLYRELNAGATIDPRETPYKKLISNFKKAAVMLSGSVVVQQFSSIGRAYAVIDPKYFVGAKVNSNTKLTATEEMKKYAPVAIIKEMGGFDTGTKGSAKNYIMAEKYGKGERIKGFMKDEQYRGDIMGIAPAKADEMTWSTIWEAAKRETKAMHPKMDVKSEEFLKLAGERFSEVIEKTQVYDSVLARSANMRSKTGLMQMATAFMAEPTTTINLLEDALRGRSVKKIARAFGSVAASIVLNNALASIVYAMRDDDDDDTFLEKYGQSFFSGLIDDVNPMTYYPFLKDIYSLFQGYDVERADMSVIADLRDALKKAITLIGKDTAEMDDDELAEHWKNVNGVLMGILDAGCSALGVPVKNVRRDVNGIINAYNTIKADVTERDTTWNSFWDKVGAAAKDTIPIYAFTKDRTKNDKLYDTIVSGDKEYLGRIKSTYKTEDAYHSAVRKALRENDPRIKEAAQAHINGNPSERVSIARQIIADGFEQDDVVMAINAEINAMTPDDDTGTKKTKGFYAVEDFVRETANGDQAAANAVRDDVIQTAQKNGKTAEEAEKSFASSVKSETKKAYLDGNLNDSQAEKILLAVGETEEDVAPFVIYWDFCRKHPQYDFSQSNVEKYLEFAEPAGISVDVFVQYINGTKGLATIYDEWGDVELSKRDQVLEVIDSLDLTWEQKDALYLAAGYAESEIWDVPW